MPTTALSPVPRMQFLDPNGNPLAGGLVYTYAAGTTTPQASYTDSTGTVLNSNPVVLDSGGFGEIWLDSTLGYKIKVADSNNVQQYVVDGIFTQPQGVAFLNNAQTFTKLTTLADLIVKGPLPSGWPSSASNQLLIAGSDPTHALGANVIGRIYLGDGTGWNLGFAKRTGGVDTDIYQFGDEGALIVGSNSPSPSIYLAHASSAGNTASDVRMVLNTAGKMEMTLGDGSDDADLLLRNLFLTGTVKQAAGITAAGTGIGVIAASVDLVGQSAAIATTNLIAAAKQGMYTLHYYLVLTTAGSAANLVGQFGWNDGANTRSVATANLDCTTLADSTTAVGLGQISFWQPSGGVGNPITYATTLSAGIGVGRYELHMRLIYLG